jgi:hypothetical protein
MKGILAPSVSVMNPNGFYFSGMSKNRGHINPDTEDYLKERIQKRSLLGAFAT